MEKSSKLDRRETGIEGRLGAMPSPKFEICLISPYFLRSSLKSFGNSLGNLYITFNILKYQGFFYLWGIGPVLKQYKVPKYFDQDCLKIFVLLFTLSMMIQISGKSHHFNQKCLFYQNLPTSLVERFLKSSFDLN